MLIKKKKKTGQASGLVVDTRIPYLSAPVQIPTLLLFHFSANKEPGRQRVIA